MDIVVKLLDENRVDDVLHFFNTERGDKPQFFKRQKTEFEWLFLKGYYKKALYAIACDSQSDEIIGTNAGILIPMKRSNGETVVSLKGEDTLISLDKMIRYGRRDLLLELFNTTREKAISENVSFMWGFTPAKSAFRRCGFEISEPVKGSFLVLKPCSFYSMRVRTTGVTSLARKAVLFSFSLINLISQRRFISRPLKIKHSKTDVKSMDFRKLQGFVPKDSCSLLLDEKFLDWRITSNPSEVRYGFLEFRNKNEDIIAYLIYSENKDKVYYIEQFLFDNNLSEKEKLETIDSARRFFKDDNAVVVRALGFSHNKVNVEEMRLLGKAGFHFFSNKEPSYFIFQDLGKTGLVMSDIYVSRLNTQGVV